MMVLQMLVETGGTDADNDGRIDGFIDVDGNGLHDPLIIRNYMLKIMLQVHLQKLIVLVLGMIMMLSQQLMR